MSGKFWQGPLGGARHNFLGEGMRPEPEEAPLGFSLTSDCCCHG